MQVHRICGCVSDNHDVADRRARLHDDPFTSSARRIALGPAPRTATRVTRPAAAQSSLARRTRMERHNSTTETDDRPRARITLTNRVVRRLANPVQELLSFPWLVIALLYNPRIDAAYGLTGAKRLRLA